MRPLASLQQPLPISLFDAEVDRPSQPRPAAVVKAGALKLIKVWHPPLRWRDGYIVLNGAELKISEFPDLFDAFGHHFGGQGTTFRLPASGGPPGHEALTSVDAAWRGLFYPAVVGPFAHLDTEDIRRRLAVGGFFSWPRRHWSAQGYIDVRTATKTRVRRRRDIQ